MKRKTIMRSILLFTGLLAMLFAMSANVYATDTPDSDPVNATLEIVSEDISVSPLDSEENRAALGQKKAEVQAFLADFQEEREVIQQNREKNKELAAENKELRQDLKLKLKEMKDNGTAPDEETAVELAGLREELRTQTEALTDTKGDIKTIIEENKKNIRALDSEATEAAFDEIIEIQQQRYDYLLQINGILKDMMALL